MPLHSKTTAPAPSAESSAATGRPPADSPSAPVCGCCSKAVRNKLAAPPCHRSSALPSTPDSKPPPASPPDTRHPHRHADPERTKLHAVGGMQPPPPLCSAHLVATWLWKSCHSAPERVEG